MDGFVEHVVLPLAYVWPEDNGSGGAGTRLRINHAAELVTEGRLPENVTVIFTAGLPLGETQRLPMAIRQAEYARTRAEFAKAEIIARPTAWGTLAEVREAMKIIWNGGRGRNARWTFVSDCAHLWRVRVIWNLLNPNKYQQTDWRANFVGITHMTWKERWLREPLVCARDWSRLRFSKQNRKLT